jgi:multidrug efflux pump subunit AcrA (membrane-fusion protein)
MSKVENKVIPARNNMKQIFSNRKRVIAVIILILVLGFGGWKLFFNKKQTTQYQTAQAEKGTLVVSVSASGNISAGNNVAITTGVSGNVNQVYVKNGDTVTQGQKIADITPDRDTQQKQAQSWASYLSAKNQVSSAQAALFSTQSTMYSKWQAYMDIAQNSTYQNPDNSANTNNRVLTPFTIAQDNWLAAEAGYKNEQDAVIQAQAALASNWLSYQQLSSTIIAPSAGVVSNLSIAPGVPINALSTTSSSSNSVATQQIGSISLTQGSIQSIVSLSEIDAAKVKVGQKVTLTMDAFPDQTYTGKVLLINTNGTVSSGVTTYPTIISFDTSQTNIYPNMAITAKIITNIKDNVILIPSGAVQSTNGTSTVRILKNGQVSTVTVETGDSNDTQTEITSGVNEGDNIVTSAISAATTSTQSTSIFSSLGGRGFGGGGGR